MKISARLLLLVWLGCAAGAARAQYDPPPPQSQDGRTERQDAMEREERLRRMEERHEQMRERRDAWQQMSPQERHQLRHDIREAGRSIYPRGSGRHR